MHVLAFILKGSLFSKHCDKRRPPPRLPSAHGAVLVLRSPGSLLPGSGWAPSLRESPLVRAQAEHLGQQRSNGEPSAALTAPCAQARANVAMSAAESCEGWRPLESGRIWLLVQAAQSPRGEVSQGIYIPTAVLSQCAPGSKG